MALENEKKVVFMAWGDRKFVQMSTKFKLTTEIVCVLHRQNQLGICDLNQLLRDFTYFYLKTT